MVDPSKSKKLEEIFKWSSYAVNYIARPLGNYFKKGLDLGNPWGAITFWALDLVAKIPGVSKSGCYQNAELLGGMFYGFKTIKDLVLIAKGDYDSLIDLPFDASMAGTLFMNAGKSIAEDKFKFFWNDFDKKSK